MRLTKDNNHAKFQPDRPSGSKYFHKSMGGEVRWGGKMCFLRHARTQCAHAKNTVNIPPCWHAPKISSHKCRYLCYCHKKDQVFPPKTFPLDEPQKRWIYEPKNVWMAIGISKSKQVLPERSFGNILSYNRRDTRYGGISPRSPLSWISPILNKTKPLQKDTFSVKNAKCCSKCQTEGAPISHCYTWT